MSSTGKVKVGIIGSQFEADIHAASFQLMPEEAEVVAVASPTPGHRRSWRASTGSRASTRLPEMLRDDDIEWDHRGPHSLHARMTIDIANAGKHVVVKSRCA